jgi:hypothetical protein
MEINDRSVLTQFPRRIWFAPTNSLDTNQPSLQLPLAMAELVSGEKPSPFRYENEEFWVSMQPFLHAQGYQLRPRYHPNWIPSWTGRKGLYPQLNCEDDIASFAVRFTCF